MAHILIVEARFYDHLNDMLLAANARRPDSATVYAVHARIVDELAALEDYAKREGLENACRVILNLNEFSFVD